MLHQVLDVTFFMPTGHVAEPRVEQVPAAQFHELRVEIPLATATDTNHRRLQIVIRQPLGHAPQGRERPHMTVQNRDLILSLIRPHERRTTERQPQAKELQRPLLTTDEHGGLAPIHLSLFTRRKHQRHIHVAGL